MLSGIAQGEGQMKPVMHAMGLGIGLNLVLGPILILLLDFGVAGAALATCIAQAVSLLYLARIFFSGTMQVPLHVNILRARPEAMAKILEVGLPQGLAEILVAFYLFAINRIVVGIDPTAMTAFGLCARVDQLLLLSIAAISSAILTAVAQNAARGNLTRVRELQRAAIRGGVALVLAQAALLVVFAPWIYGLLSETEAVIRLRREPDPHRQPCLPVRGADADLSRGLPGRGASVARHHDPVPQDVRRDPAAGPAAEPFLRPRHVRPVVRHRGGRGVSRRDRARVECRVSCAAAERGIDRGGSLAACGRIFVSPSATCNATGAAAPSRCRPSALASWRWCWRAASSSGSSGPCEPRR
ncbi:MAG: hypothetical protein IPF57_24225 [Gammaproteobacteria bacterium]|nr:hypothetical protein [Gammaproteobacteria bacterium]